MRMFRQGDVLMQQVEDIPATHQVVPAENGRLILMHGEATGHHHSIAATAGTLVTDREDVLYMTLDQLTEVQHPEHRAITLPPGKYRITRQREWTDANEPRPVAD